MIVVLLALIWLYGFVLDRAVTNLTEVRRQRNRYLAAVSWCAADLDGFLIPRQPQLL